MPVNMDILQLSQNVSQKLRAPFQDESVILDYKHRKPDGFVPAYIPWDKITERLDEVFGSAWSFEIIGKEILHNQAIVHGRVTVRVQSKEDGSIYDIKKDGIGTVELTVCDGKYAEIGDDLKAAASEALKRCAVLFGVGIQLYQRCRKDIINSQQMQQPPVQMDERQTLLNTVRGHLLRARYAEEHACRQLRVQRLENLSDSDLRDLATLKHPFMQVIGMGVTPLATSNA